MVRNKFFLWCLRFLISRLRYALDSVGSFLTGLRCSLYICGRCNKASHGVVHLLITEHLTGLDQNT